MLRNLGTHRILWLLAGLLSLGVALVGVLSPSIYDQVVSREILPGVISQDGMTVVASLVLLFLAARVQPRNAKGQIVALGILGYLFYAYGIYVIEQLYTVLYLVYMAILGVVFYAIAYGVASIRREQLTVKLPQGIRRASVALALLNPLMFYPLWISQIVPLIQTGTRLEFLFSVYILDLCFIMPAFVLVAVQTIKRKALGLLLTPAMFVLGFTLLAPLAVGELLKPGYGASTDVAFLGLFGLLSALFLVLAVLYLRKLDIRGTATES